MVLVDSESVSCSADALEWFCFIATLVLLCLPWWATDIPGLFTNPSSPPKRHVVLEPLRASSFSPNSPPPYSAEQGDAAPPAELDESHASISWRGRAKRFFHAIQWNCLRAIQPGYVAAFSILRDPDPNAWVVVYYFGPDVEGRTRVGMRRWAKIIATESLVLPLQALLIYIGSTDFDKDGHMIPGWWIVGLVPATVTGISLLALRMLGRSPGFSGVMCLGFGIHLLAAVAITVPITVTAKSLGTFGSAGNLGGIIAVEWVMMIIPMAMCKCRNAFVRVVFMLLPTVLRVGPFAISLTGSSKDFPYCSINGLPLFFAFLGIQWGFVFILACFGVARAEKMRPSVHWYKQQESLRQQRVTGVAGSQERLNDPESQQHVGESGTNDDDGASAPPPYSPSRRRTTG